MRIGNHIKTSIYFYPNYFIFYVIVLICIVPIHVSSFTLIYIGSWCYTCHSILRFGCIQNFLIYPNIYNSNLPNLKLYSVRLSLKFSTKLELTIKV